MANTLDAGSFKEFWSRRMQRRHERSDVFRAIASFEEQAQLKQGDTVNRPYRSSLTAQTYTRGSDVTFQDLTNTNETLSVNQSQIIPFYVDDLDELQTNYRNAAEYADDAAVKLGNRIDGDVLGEYDQAPSANQLDDGDIGGTAGNGITFTTSNILKVFAVAKKLLARQNVFDNLFAVLSPDAEQVLLEYLAGKESQLGDTTNLNGNLGKFYGFDLFRSNSVGWSARLEMGSAATADDTITINGVVLTAKASPSAAGEFDVEASASAQVTTLATSINAPTTTVTNEFVALSTANATASRTQ